MNISFIQKAKILKKNYSSLSSSLDCLFIVPPSPVPAGSQLLRHLLTLSPLGIGYLISILRQHGFTAEGLNLYTGLSDISKLILYFSKVKPKIIGFSTMTENFLNGIELAKLCKKVLPNSIIIFGGPHVSFLDEETLKTGAVDCVVRGEGEITIVELCNCLLKNSSSLYEIPGISFLSNSHIQRTPRRHFITNLSDLPFPERNIKDLDGNIPEWGRGVLVTSRGCPNKCKFCAAAGMSGGHYRLTSVERIMEEIAYLEQSGVIKKNIPLLFADNTVTGDTNRLLEFCNVLKNKYIKWSAESRVDIITPVIVDAMKEAHCVGLQFGVESGSQEVLEYAQKNITLKQVESAVKLTARANIPVICSFMIGLPWDTCESIKVTLDFALKLEEKYNVGILMGATVPYPGTYIHHHCDKLKVKIITKNYNLYHNLNPIMDTSTLTHEQIREFLYDALFKIYNSMPNKYLDAFSKIVKYSLYQQGYATFSYSDAPDKQIITKYG
ncbi:MAG: hypothetical protein B5M53_05495 [Candidatus Cloacimonas sp. 4484_209]|nr:MAG: hypothetical protein B5M53_05495 [Candidatus Cloacimonas sp. 4484_209]